MTKTIRVHEWNGHTWAGWWQGDEERPTTYENVHLRQLDQGQLYVGQVMSFDVPNGDDWNPSEPGLDRHTMEGAVVDFYSGDFTLEGFVHVERHGRTHSNLDDPDPASFRKQRWVVTSSLGADEGDKI